MCNNTTEQKQTPNNCSFMESVKAKTLNKKTKYLVNDNMMNIKCLSEET